MNQINKDENYSEETMLLLRRIKHMRLPKFDVKIGEFTKFHHPKKALKLIHSSYCTYTHTESYYYCPKCRKVNDEEHEHGDAWKCSCGLCRQIYGNSLYIWYQDKKLSSLDIKDIKGNKDLSMNKLIFNTHKFGY